MYILQKNGSVVRLSDRACIPNSPGNRDWQEYQDWCAEGNTPIPAQPSPYHTLDDSNEWIEDFERWIAMEIRVKRDSKLSACDYKIMPDYPIEPSKKIEIESYRQKLRDLPEQITEIVDPVPWPLEPAP